MIRTVTNKASHILLKKLQWQFSLSLLFLFIFTASLFSQTEIDSLLKAANASSGPAKAKTLLLLANKYGQKDTTKAFSFAYQSFVVSKKCNYRLGIVNYFCFKARTLSQKEGGKKAIDFLNRSFAYFDTLKPSSEWGSYYITLGSIYNDIAKLNDASGAYLHALKIFDQINDTIGIARACHGLGLVNHNVGNTDDAEKYYLKALKYYRLAKMHDKETGVIANLGALFLDNAMKTHDEKGYKKAFEYINQGLAIATEYSNYEIMGNCYNNLASLYGSRNELDTCLKCDFKALEIRQQHNIKYGIASSLANIGFVYQLKGNDAESEKYILESDRLSSELHSPRLLAGNYEALSQLYTKQKKFEKALDFYKKASEMRDSMNNADKIKSMTELEKQYDTEKKDKEIELLNQTQQANDAQLARQKTVNYAIGLGLTLVVMFSFFLLRANGQKRKVNDKLHLQNNIIEEKNRNITDSINYAKTIQSAIIPDKEEFSKNFSDSFVLYMPKDIVSGDFYWITNLDDKVLFATVDCTGHGVPGGFMSMLGYSLLSEIVNERKIFSPAVILNQLRDKIIENLRQKGHSGESQDGMDLTLCSLDKRSLKLTYSNAYNPFYLVRNNELTESELNKMPVGYHQIIEPFREFEMQLQKGDHLYLFTDGYADQFGGDKGKKFKYSRLKELIISLQGKTMNEQKNNIEKTTIDWRGKLEQVDDICLIGIKI